MISMETPGRIAVRLKKKKKKAILLSELRSLQ